VTQVMFLCEMRSPRGSCFVPAYSWCGLFSSDYGAMDACMDNFLLSNEQS
jgi:hypothetical protein